MMTGRGAAVSEPRAVAGEPREVIPGLLHFHIHDERIDFPSEAYAGATAPGAILIDPLPLGEAALSRLGPVEAIVLGTPPHQRSAWRCRRLTGAPVHVPRGAAGLDEAPDAEYGDGDRLPGGLRAIHAPGPCRAHHVLYLAQGPGVLLLGDLLVREADAAPRFLSDDAMEDRQRARQSARRLLEYRFDVLAFGHGEPVARGGRQAFEELLRLDAGREG
jgi:glyoxylase-like metal-dependent hydrolase (beta-lactamase superfamily II)